MNLRLLALALVFTAAAVPLAAGFRARPDDPTLDMADRGPGRLDDEPFEAPVDTHGESALLRRWNRLTPQEQGRLRERFEHYKKIEDSERRRLAKRGKRLDQLARHLYRDLPERDRKRVDALSASKRREIMREMAADKARDVGRRIHDKLPRPLRRRLEGAAPEERARCLDDFRASQREKMGEALVRLGEELEIEDTVINRIIRLPDEKRGKKFLEFLQRRASVEVGRRGLPPGVTPEQWRAIGDLPGDEFFEAIMDLREAHPTLAMPPSVTGSSDGGERHDRPRRSVARRHLIRAGRPVPGDRIELSHWDPADRREEIQRRRRERVQRVLREEALVPSEELDELARLPDGAFFSRVRSLASRTE